MHVRDVIHDDSSVGRYTDFFFLAVSEDPLKRTSSDGITKINDDVVLREHLGRALQASETLNVAWCRDSKDSRFTELSAYKASLRNNSKSDVEVDSLRPQIAPPIFRNQIQRQLGIVGKEAPQRHRRDHAKKPGIDGKPQDAARRPLVIQRLGNGILKGFQKRRDSCIEFCASFVRTTCLVVRSKRRNPNRFSRLAIERLTHACEIERSFAAALKLRFLAVAMKLLGHQAILHRSSYLSILT
jgi:hypothetical protein